MKVIVKSVEDTFTYVMDHYAPAGLEEMATRTDTYAIISIQDTHLQNFGFEFTKNEYCKGVLTLLVDDIVKPVDGAVLFSEDHARRILEFVDTMKGKIDTLVIHCYAGNSRSAAVGKALLDRSGADSSKLTRRTNPNQHIYRLLMES